MVISQILESACYHLFNFEYFLIVPEMWNGNYCKNAVGVAIFLKVVHCSFDEYLRRIPQHLHELHRKVPHLLSCGDKDAVTVKTKKKFENYKLLKS